MAISYLGSLSTAQLVPIAATALNAAVVELQAQVSALATATASVDFGGIAGQIVLAQQLLAALQAALALGVQPPTVSFQASAIVALGVKLEALLAFQSIMQAGGIHALLYTGRADGFADELAGAVGELPGVQPSDTARALALVATTPAAIEALAAAFT